jgi:hypothetical protein
MTNMTGSKLSIFSRNIKLGQYELKLERENELSTTDDTSM